MIDAELMSILCCPETHQGLRPAAPGLIEELNRRIEAGELRNRGGTVVKEKLEEGLVREDGKVLYPVRRNIPVMLVDEGVEGEFG